MGDLNNPNENNNEPKIDNQNSLDQSQLQQLQDPNAQSQQDGQGQQNVQSQYQQSAPNQNPYQQSAPNQNTYQQYGTPQNQYQQNYVQYGEYQEPKKSNGMAIGSMVCGIISILISCCWYIGLPLAIVSIVLGIIVLKNKKDGKGMAIAGIVLSGITVIIAIVAIIGVVFLANNESFMDEFYKGFYEGLESSNY